MEYRYDVLSRKMNTDPDFKLEVIQKTSFLDDSSTNVRRLWHILNNIYYIPNCKNCGTIVDFSKRQGVGKGYNSFCSASCKITYLNKNRGEDEQKYRKESIRKTSLEKYGVEHFSKSNQVKQKKIDTYLNRYGVDNPSKLENIKERKKETCVKNYGVDNPSKSIEIHSKKSSFSRNKIVESNSGKIYKVDGYEYLALKELFEMGYSDSDILTRDEIKNLIGVIKYDYENKSKVYHPDIFILSENRIIEVKSEYWFRRDYLLNMKKKQNVKKWDLSLNSGYMIQNQNTLKE